MTNIAGTANTIVGQYGLLENDLYLRKMETTNIYEDPDQTENYMRGLMKDFKPDEPFFESDQARGGKDKYGNDRSGYQSESVINLRSGARTLTDPYLPDGTFTDWQFLEKDPRGIATGPDMKQHAKQQYARSGFYNYRDDGDNSIMESGWNPWKAQMQIRNAQNIFKEYFKNFQTSMDSWHNGGIGSYKKVSVKEKDGLSGEIKDPLQASNTNRIDVTNTLSNNTMIGWRNTTDHRFNVAKYGRRNLSKSYTDEDWYKNRSNVNTTHDTRVSLEEMPTSKSTALLMMDLSKKREMHQFTGLNGVNFNKSSKAANTARKLTPADMAGMINRPSLESRSEDANNSLKGEIKDSKKTRNHKYATVLNKTVINPEIIEKIASVTSKTIKSKDSDLRDFIDQSASNDNLYLTKNNTKSVKKSDQEAMWNSDADYHKGKSKKVHNYKSVVRSVENTGKKLDMVDGSANFAKSFIANQRRGKLDTSNKSTKNGDTDNIYGKEVTRAHLTGPIGSKYMNKYMDTDTKTNDINDHV
jgi:hypothetical protein